MGASPGIKIYVDYLSSLVSRFLVPNCGRFCKSGIFGAHLKSNFGASFDGCLTLLHHHHQREWILPTIIFAGRRICGRQKEIPAACRLVWLVRRRNYYLWRRNNGLSMWSA
uniref:Uncharacterized protein n=1 Tax=Opuntia streptacantha TaxID=393608 RepID=A0A7C8ZJJ1_OPUST